MPPRPTSTRRPCRPPQVLLGKRRPARQATRMWPCRLPPWLAVYIGTEGSYVRPTVAAQPAEHSHELLRAVGGGPLVGAAERSPRANVSPSMFWRSRPAGWRQPELGEKFSVSADLECRPASSPSCTSLSSSPAALRPSSATRTAPPPATAKSHVPQEPVCRGRHRSRALPSFARGRSWARHCLVARI